MCAGMIGREMVYIGFSQCTSEYLIGKLDEGGEWHDGVFSASLRRAGRDDKVPTWIVLDGPLDTELMEPLHTVLDDNKALCLQTGERIRVGSHVRVVLLMDVQSSASLTPAVVSRLGKVNMMPEPSASKRRHLDGNYGNDDVSNANNNVVVSNKLRRVDSSLSKHSTRTDPGCEVDPPAFSVSLAGLLDVPVDEQSNLGTGNISKNENLADSVLEKCSAENWGFSEKAVAGFDELDVRVQQMGSTLATGPWLSSEPGPTAVASIDVFMKADESVRAHNQADRFVGKHVVMVAGKYKGRRGFVECKLSKKYRVHLEDVGYVLEFYPRQFSLPQELDSYAP
eukprot:TRINITY_DN61999_c0_g2_i2.p1 TRINITY_DN61999_c0_g2~~TRINITY_DN61999_c0_g2_i2.p1  ORF type:complete len:339 (-),score=67.37 TRINITY_DN61999_c0_g2_i2:199-1215(-)